jgi:hypothetical protein
MRKIFVKHFCLQFSEGYVFSKDTNNAVDILFPSLKFRRPDISLCSGRKRKGRNNQSPKIYGYLKPQTILSAQNIENIKAVIMMNKRIQNVRFVG